MSTFAGLPWLYPNIKKDARAYEAPHLIYHRSNYFIQNIRNNRGKGRTPKWALKAGLVEDDTAYMKSTRQWNNRYEQQNARNAYEDDNVPEEDEYGNPIERAIVEHGRHPAQPSAGFGDDGNETARTARQDDLLAGLPDEERDARRKAKKNQRTEYGSGFDDEYTTQQDSAASRRQKDSLLYDLEDGDATLYGGGKSGGSTLSQARAKSGKQKKSERYGLAPDHRDLNGSSSGSLRNGSSGRSSKGRQQSSGSDRYDVVDNSNGSRRRAGGEE